MYDNNRIKVGNTFIYIDNYEMGESEQLEKVFKIFDIITHRFYYKGMYYDKENKRLYIPSGMDLWFVRRALGEKYYTRVPSHKYLPTVNMGMKYKPRDEKQVEYLKFMVGIDNYADNQDKSQLFLNANTGSGKTYCSIATICFFKIKSIVITSSNSLLSQWEDNIIEYTDMDRKDIFRISGSDLCNMILSGKSAKANNASIYLCSHGTLRSFGERYGWDKVYALFEYLGIGMKFYDEAHTSFDNMLMIDFFTNVYKTYYVTATAGRSNWRENHIYQISLKNVPMINLFDENNDPHTSYCAIKWNSKPSPQVISACKNKYGLDRNKYIDYVTKNPEFYKMMRIIMDLVIKCKGRVLMYIGTNDGILRLYDWLGKNYPEFIGDIGIFTSLVDKEMKMEEKKKKLLISTTKSAGLGEHIEGLKMTIVLAEPFKSEIIARQTLGRTRDDNTMYIELVDMAFLYIRKFYNAKIPVFNKYATDVSDMSIDQYELDRRSTLIQQERTHWQRCPISLDDKRFDFEAAWGKRKEIEPNMTRCPISFVNDDNIRI